MKVSKIQLRVLRDLRRGPSNAHHLKCSVSTLCALEKRKLIHVETTFESVAFPRKALTYITDAGREAAIHI